MLLKAIKFSLEEVDKFRKKLVTSPAYTETTKVLDLNKELDTMKQYILVEPDEVQKSLVSKMWETIIPWKTNKKDPKVQTKTRGRPRKDKKNVRPPRRSSFVNMDHGRHSSVINEEHARHSSFATPSAMPPPVMFDFMGLSQQDSAQSVVDGGRHSSYVPSMENRFYFFLYQNDIPKVFHPHVGRIMDVNPDGNCGFRCVAVGLEMEENQ